MDVDSFIAKNAPAWSRLDELSRRAASDPGRLGAEDLDEFARLYGQVSTHLSQATTRYGDPGLSARLSGILARAGASLHGSRRRARPSLATFLRVTVPEAIAHLGPFIGVSAALTFVPALLMALWITHSPSLVHSLAPPADIRRYVNESFGNYYRSAPAIQFSTHVYVNNVLVAMEAFAFGALLCVPTALILVVNGVNLGVAAGLLTATGHASRFWVLVTPHGMLELTSVVVAGAAGLRLGWTVVDPGDRWRRQAFAEEGRQAVVALVAVAFSLGVAGAIEGTVTGSSLPPWIRVGIGAVAETAVLAYLIRYKPRRPGQRAFCPSSSSRPQAGLATISHTAAT
jgi:uncharacterized membrane protein SpoIIM required for sporulation